MNDRNKMNSLERTTLRNCERVLARGVETFREVGEALAQIRDEQLFRATHDSFKAYCKDKWDFSDSRARQLIGGAKKAKMVESVTRVTPSDEKRTRPLNRLPESEQPKVWLDAVEMAGGNQPTVEQVEQAVRYQLGEDDDDEYETVEVDQCTVCGGVTWQLNGDCAQCSQAKNAPPSDPDPLDMEEEAIQQTGATPEKPDYGKCPNCAGTKWTTGDDGVTCKKCHHPHGTCAGDPDEGRVATQRSKTVKTVESLMRAFDDLQLLLAKPEHDEAITSCKSLLKMAKSWK